MTLGVELTQLQKKLEEKDDLIRIITESSGQLSALKSWYEQRLSDLENDRTRLQKERSDIFQV